MYQSLSVCAVAVLAAALAAGCTRPAGAQDSPAPDLTAQQTLGGDILPFSGFSGPTSPNVQVEDGRLVMDTRFVATLLEKPDGALFDANRNELLYLVSRNDDAAIRAGFAVLAVLLRRPQTFIEGDREYQRYGKEELAFALSRTERAPEVLCRLPPADRALVVAFYQHNPVLWRNVDPPWQPGNLACAVTVVGEK